VGDAEAGFEIACGLFEEGIIRISIWHQKMDRQRIRCCAERPDMKIVQIDDARERAQPCLDRSQIGSLRGPVEA